MTAWLRYPKTTQERRRWFADAAELRLRAARSPHNNLNLPSSWDDIARRPQRCWKEQRRLKWRRIVRG
jgi:hypothetical protein